jgi:hypothetical protein
MSSRVRAGGRWMPGGCWTRETLRLRDLSACGAPCTCTWLQLPHCCAAPTSHPAPTSTHQTPTTHQPTSTQQTPNTHQPTSTHLILSRASDALEISSRRKISLLE